MIYNKDTIAESIGLEIDEVEELLNNPSCEDEKYSDGCDDGSYTMCRSYETDDNDNWLRLYYNSLDRLVCDYELIKE